MCITHQTICKRFVLCQITWIIVQLTFGRVSVQFSTKSLKRTKTLTQCTFIMMVHPRNINKKQISSCYPARLKPRFETDNLEFLRKWAWQRCTGGVGESLKRTANNLVLRGHDATYFAHITKQQQSAVFVFVVKPFEAANRAKLLESKKLKPIPCT